MIKYLGVIAAGTVMLGASFATAASLPVGSDLAPPSSVIKVAQGCGPGAWRGPWGGCRDTPYTGPLPGGGYVAGGGGFAYYGNGCPVGSWRGPWGHCRNTPYHGPLPGGGYK